MPKPLAARTNKTWTILPNALLRATFLHTLYGWPWIPGIGSKNVFLGTFRTVTIVRRFCRIQPVQMHYPHLRRPVPSRESACHHPLMHAAHLNRRIQMRRESDEAHHYLLCSPRTLIETWALECVFYKKYYGCCDMAKVLYILCTGSVVHIHQTLYEHIRTTSSCRLLFVLRTDIMSMLLDYVIQHGLDGAHCQWYTLLYTMGDYHQVLSRLAL